MDNLSDRRGERPLLIDLSLHPSGLRGQVGVYGQFMSFMRAVRAEIEYLTALRDSQNHDFARRLQLRVALEAAGVHLKRIMGYFYRIALNTRLFGAWQIV